VWQYSVFDSLGDTFLGFAVAKQFTEISSQAVTPLNQTLHLLYFIIIIRKSQWKLQQKINLQKNKKAVLTFCDKIRLTKSSFFDIIKEKRKAKTMKELKIKLTNVQDIRNFVNEVILVDYDVDLVQGRYVIDAKSIMGIFSLDLLSPIDLVAHTENADKLFAQIAKFAV
jgi:hypothetical protein